MDPDEAYDIMKGVPKDRPEESAAASRKEFVGQGRDTRQEQNTDQGAQASADKRANELMRFASLLREIAKSASLREPLLIYVKEVELIAQAERQIENPLLAYQQQKQRMGAPKGREDPQPVKKEERRGARPGTQSASPPPVIQNKSQGRTERGGRSTKSDLPPSIPRGTPPQATSRSIILPAGISPSGSPAGTPPQATSLPAILPAGGFPRASPRGSPRGPLSKQPENRASSTEHFSSPSSCRTVSEARSTEDDSPSTGSSRGPIAHKTRNTGRNSPPEMPILCDSPGDPGRGLPGYGVRNTGPESHPVSPQPTARASAIPPPRTPLPGSLTGPARGQTERGPKNTQRGSPPRLQEENLLIQALKISDRGGSAGSDSKRRPKG
jgi:hypothetical protein